MAVDGGDGRQRKGDDAAQELVVIVAKEGRVRREAVEVEAVPVDRVGSGSEMSARKVAARYWRKRTPVSSHRG